MILYGIISLGYLLLRSNFMSRIEDFLVRNTKSAICFMFAFICSFFIAIAIFDYSNNKYVYDNDLSNINFLLLKVTFFKKIGIFL